MGKNKYIALGGTHYWIEERYVRCPMKRRDGTLDHKRVIYRAHWFLCHELKGFGVSATSSEICKSKSVAEAKFAKLVNRQVKHGEHCDAQV
jgi:hypothetical protein